VSELCHAGSIKAKRSGLTEKISVSLGRSDLASLEKRAKRLYSAGKCTRRRERVSSGRGLAKHEVSDGHLS